MIPNALEGKFFICCSTVSARIGLNRFNITIRIKSRGFFIALRIEEIRLSAILMEGKLGWSGKDYEMMGECCKAGSLWGIWATLFSWRSNVQCLEEYLPSNAFFSENDDETLMEYFVHAVHEISVRKTELPGLLRAHRGRLRNVNVQQQTSCRTDASQMTLAIKTTGAKCEEEFCIV